MSTTAGAHSAQETGARTSHLLLQAVKGDSERISVGEILDALDARAFGLATLLFSLFSIVPMPPGIPTVVGIALFIVSVQMVFGRHELWLPRFLTKRSFPRQALLGGLEKLIPRLEAVEKIARPRMLFLTGKVGTVLIGLAILFLAIVLILPLPPGGNFPPALAAAIFGMGLAERDGLIVIFGVITSIIATIVVSVVTLVSINYIQDFISWISGLFGGGA